MPQSAWIHVSTLGAFYHLTAECIRLKPAASNWLKLGLLSAAKIVQRIYSFSQCVAIFAEITEIECVKERHPCRIRTFDWYQKSVTLERRNDRRRVTCDISEVAELLVMKLITLSKWRWHFEGHTLKGQGLRQIFRRRHIPILGSPLAVTRKSIVWLS